MPALSITTGKQGAYQFVAFPTADPFRPRNGETKAKCKYKLSLCGDWLFCPGFPVSGTEGVESGAIKEIFTCSTIWYAPVNIGSHHFYVLLAMPNKTGLVFLSVVFVACLALFSSSCKKVPPPPWLSLNFAGTFSGNDVCLLSATQPDSITVVATGATEVNITNLYGPGKVFYGNVSNDSCYIVPQVYNNGTGNAIMQGNFVMTGDTINLFIIVSTFGQEDKCTAVLVKNK